MNSWNTASETLTRARSSERAYGCVCSTDGNGVLTVTEFTNGLLRDGDSEFPDAIDDSEFREMMDRLSEAIQNAAESLGVPEKQAQIEALGSSAEDAEVWTKSMTYGHDMRNSRDMRPPLQQSRLWKIPPIRALLLGTTSQGSLLCQLPKSDGVLNIILGFVVLHYEREVPCV